MEFKLVRLGAAKVFQPKYARKQDLGAGNACRPRGALQVFLASSTAAAAQDAAASLLELMAKLGSA